MSESALRAQFREVGVVNSTIPVTDELVDLFKDLFLHTHIMTRKLLAYTTSSEEFPPSTWTDKSSTEG